MLKKLTAFILTAAILCVSVYAAPSPWASAEVKTATNYSLVPENLLSDYQNPITREEFCSMALRLYKALSTKDVPAGKNVFSDTQNADVASAFTLGIVKGISDTLFAPSSLITREEIATMFRRCVSAALPAQDISAPLVNTFPDEENISDWAIDAIKLANMCQVILGDENANINPKANTTREQAILMTLRLYNCFKKTNSSVLESYGLATSGNSTFNMLGGSFAIKTLSGEMYLADDTGVYNFDTKSYITKRKISSMYVASENIYFIDEADKTLYEADIQNKSETLLYKCAVSFYPSGEYIYIKNEKNALVALSTKTGNVTPIAENITSMPLPSANTVYFATEDGIRSYNILKNEYTDVYSGIAKEATIKDNTIYFKNDENYLCSISLSGENFKSLSPIPVNKYCLYTSSVAYTTDDGIYKCDLSGKFNIKMTNDTSYAINSYEKTLYLKSPEEKIFKFNPFTGEKTLLN